MYCIYFQDVRCEFDEFRVSTHILNPCLLVLVVLCYVGEQKEIGRGPFFISSLVFFFLIFLFFVILLGFICALGCFLGGMRCC